MKVWLLLLVVILTVGAEEPSDVESTLHPLTVPAPVALEKFDLDFDFRSAPKPGQAVMHLDARLANNHPAAEDLHLMLVTPDSSAQMRWQGTVQDSQRLAVPFPAEGGRIVAVAETRLIFMAKESGHFMADFRLKGLPRPDNTWEFLFRRPDRNYWQNLGPSVILVRSTPWLEITREGGPGLKAQPSEPGGTLQGLEVSPFHPRGLRLLARWRGPAPELTVTATTILSAWLGLLLVLPLARRLGAVGAFLATGMVALGVGYGLRLLIEKHQLLVWTTPPGGWEEMLSPLLLTASGLAGLGAAWWARRRH